VSVVAVDYPFPNRLLLKVTGSVDVVEMRRVLISLRAGPDRLTPILFDLTEATAQISATDVASLAEMAVLEMKRAPLGPVALITMDDEMFGLSRMYQSHNSASGRSHVGVFRDPEAAERWLQTLP
jgi:hypothetical protein